MAKKKKSGTKRSAPRRAATRRTSRRAKLPQARPAGEASRVEKNRDLAPAPQSPLTPGPETVG